MIQGIARWALPLGVMVSVAVLFGLLSWYFWVIALFPVVLGVALGWSFVFGAVALQGRRPPWVLLAVLVVGGFSVEQIFEDHHQRRAFADALFETRAAASGMSPAEIASLRETSGTAFLARDADALFDAQLDERLGVSGPLGRFVSRLDAGVRLGGPWRGGRGLEVGLPGGILWLGLELSLATFLAYRIVRASPARGRPDA